MYIYTLEEIKSVYKHELSTQGVDGDMLEHIDNEGFLHALQEYIQDIFDFYGYDKDTDEPLYTS